MYSTITEQFINVIEGSLNDNSWDRNSTKLGPFEGKQVIVYDEYPDPEDNQMLACISALENDVACCEINTSGYVDPLVVPDPATWSLVGSISGRVVPDYFRYVVLDNQEAGV